MCVVGALDEVGEDEGVKGRPDSAAGQCKCRNRWA